MSERGPFRHAARDEVGGLQREFRRHPALRQLGEFAPTRRIHLARVPRPRQQHTIVIALGAEPIEQPPRIGLVLVGESPPAVPHRIQRLGLRIAESEPRRDALGILGHGDRQSRKPPGRARSKAKLVLDRDHARQRPGIGHAADQQLQEAAVGHGDRRGRSTSCDQQLQHFHAHPLGRETRKPGAATDAGEIAAAVRLALAKGGVDAEEAQDAQVIFRDALVGIADEAHAPQRNVGKPADVVVHDARRVDRQPVHGEVAPLGVPHPVTAERNLGLAAEGLGVLAQRGHFIGVPVDDQGDGAVVDAGRHALDAGAFGAPHHLLRQCGGRDIHVARPQAEQRITHGAADHARLLAVGVQELQDARGPAGGQPGRIGKQGLRAHLPAPISRRPAQACRSRHAQGHRSSSARRR